MAQLDFGGTDRSTTGFTDAWVHSPNIPIPSSPYPAANGQYYALIVWMRAYVAGRGAGRSVSLQLDGIGGTGTFGVGSSGSAQDTGAIGCNVLVAGGSGTFSIAANGSFYFGRGGSGEETDNNGLRRTDGALGGSFGYYTVPSSPSGLGVSPGVGQAALSWAAPGYQGDSGLSGYRVFYSTNPSMSGASAIDIGNVTSYTVTGLTPGTTYYFQVAARNVTTDTAGTTSQGSNVASALVGNVPGAPTALTLTPGAGFIGVAWTAPASNGGVPLDVYRVDYSTDSGFSGYASKTVSATQTGVTIAGLTPGLTYYVRVYAHNSVGYSATALSGSAAPVARGALDIVQGAAVHVNGVQVELRSDGANAPTITLGYVAFGTGSAFVTIATLPIGTDAASFAASGGPRNFALANDAAGNLYVIGRRGDDLSTVLVQSYTLTGTSTWTLTAALSQALANTGDPLVAFDAAYVPGTIASILLIARRAGTVGAGALSYATIDPVAALAGTGALFLSSGSDPSWLSTPPTGASPNTGVVDVAPLTPGGNRLVVLANGFAVIDVVGSAVTGVVKSTAGTALSAPWARVLGINATTFAVLVPSGGALSWTFYNTSGSVLGSGTYAAANAFGGAFTTQWDAFYDLAAQLVTIYYVDATAGARTLKSIDVSPLTYLASAAVTLTAALGAASSTNAELRIPEGRVDERRVLVATANLLTGVKSTAAYVDTSGNVVPSAPTLTAIAGFDATQAQAFAWVFGDSNALDTQTAYELIIERVSDGVAIVSTGKVASTVASRVVAANTLANGINYRWKVRTYDALDTVGVFSGYSTFTTSAIGTLTITTPAADGSTPDSSSAPVAWSYVQANGYVQTQRRVRLVRVSDSAVLSDTTMQASTATSYTVTGVPTDVPVRIEVSIVTNAPGTPTVGPMLRLLTASYGTPNTPLVTIVVGVSYVELDIVNPAATGSRPMPVRNYIDRRAGGTTDPWVTIANVGPSTNYRDHAVRSGKSYDYQVRAATT